MAEIKIEKKKPIWPWILAALAVLLVLYLIFANDEEAEVEPVDEIEQVEEEQGLQEENDLGETYNSQDAVVEEYVAFVNTESEDKMSLSHNFTSTALSQLVEAVKEKAEAYNVDVSQEIERVEEIESQITKHTYVEQHANQLKKAFTQLAMAIEQIQQAEGYNGTENAQNLRDQANDLVGNELLLNQKNEVHQFFEKAAEILRQMNENDDELVEDNV